MQKFILNQRKELLCPNCGSMQRDRRLYAEFNKNTTDLQNYNLLDFSPSRSLYREFKKIKSINYYPTDLSDNFISEYHFDILKIPVNNDYFDRIICFHILEHITEDITAMRELYRILKPNGLLMIQTPFKDGEHYEDPNINTDQARLEKYGQEDHVRIYSIKSLSERLESVGFNVKVKTYSPDDYIGLANGDTILFVTK